MKNEVAELADKPVVVPIKKRVLSSSEILEAPDLVPIEVEVPEWRGSVRIRPLSAVEALEFTELLNKEKKKQNEGAVRLLIASAIDDQGNQLFTEDDVARLQKKSLRAIMRIQEAALVLNGLKEDVRPAVKND